MLNKAKGSPNLVIIISRGHQFVNHSAWRLSALALLPNRRERKTGQRPINHIVHSFSQTLLTDPQGMRKRGTSTSCLCARVRDTLRNSLAWLKTEVERNRNGLLTFVWLAEHYHTPKVNGLFKKLHFFQITSKKPLPKSKLIQNLKANKQKL